MTDKPDESPAEAGTPPPPPASPPPPALPTDPIAAPQTTPLAGHQPPPVAAAPKGNWWREHLWTTVIGVSLLTGIVGLGIGFAIGFFCTSGSDSDDYGPGYHHGKRWDDRGSHHRWNDDRYDDWRGPSGRGGDSGRGDWDDRGPRRGDEMPPWMRAPRQTTPAPGMPTPGMPTPGMPAPGAPGQPQA